MKRRNYFLLFAFSICIIFLLYSGSLSNSTTKTQQWDYTVVTHQTGFQNAHPILGIPLSISFLGLVLDENNEWTNINSPSTWNERLENMAKEGWELVTAVPMITTKSTNYGNSSYITGIRMVTFTEEVNFIFRRPSSVK